MLRDQLKEFMRLEAAGGMLLLLAATLAMIAKNSPLSPLYGMLLDTTFLIRLGDFAIDKPLLLWVNDGLMAVFFFLIGLELKRHLLCGELSDVSRAVLPLIAAIGGIACPAMLYVWINWGDPVTMRGWAIPSSTDIAFALGTLALLGNRVPYSAKMFLMSVAVIDDLGAIIIIALFYTSQLYLFSLCVAALAILVLFYLNRRGVFRLTPYMLVGLVLWLAVLKSGVHATLAAVITACFIPFRTAPGETVTQLEKLETDLHPTVAYGILPIFAFANAGVPFSGLTLDSLLHPVPLGIAAGLFLGNQIGIVAFSWAAISLGIAGLPRGVTWLHLYGIALLCGIGFTMSLFLGSLAFEQGGPGVVDERVGIMIGSLLSGIAGYAVLRFLCPNQAAINA